MADRDVEISVRDQAFMDEYAALWRAYDANSFFRTPLHLRMITELSRSELLFVVAEKDGSLVAALPAAVLPGPYGVVVNSLPYFGTCTAIVGPSDGGLADCLRDGLLMHARERGAVAVTLVDDWRVRSFAAAQDARFVTERTNQYIDLASLRGRNPMDSYHQKTRNCVRKAEKGGVTARLSSDAADIDGLAAAHRDTMAGVNGIPKPETFFEMLRSPDRPLGAHKLYVASLGGRDCAYLLNFQCGDTVEYYMPAVYIAHRSAQPLSLLIHRAVTDAVADGLRYWNFGGTWLTQESLRHFKIRWGSKEVRYCYFTYILDEAILGLTAAQLQSAYPYFFVAPFDRLGARAVITGGATE
jgi:hypothetical protein